MGVIAHPELDAEQAYVDHAYRCMEAMHARVERLGGHGRNDYERDVFEWWKETRLAALSDTAAALCFGRIFRHEGDDFYIGRRHIEDRGGTTVVVDWRAPIATPFYRASRVDTMGLRRRRHFLVEGRRLLGISDDHLDDTATLHGADVLAHELARRRSGEMRDIVATIQAEQDVIIRSPLAGVVVVQGGPGTGKTAIGLHRASYLLYEHRARLARKGVLVVGPHRTFLRYIAQVLPSLGETAVTQVVVDGLAPSVPVGPVRDDDGERLKGDERMAEVLARAVATRIGRLDDDVGLAAFGVRFRLPATAANERVARLAARQLPYARGRHALREDLVTLLYRRFGDASGVSPAPVPYEDVSRALRRDPGFKSALDQLWPSLTPQALVREVLTQRSRLATAAAGLLDEVEQKALLRASVRGRWTPADRALLDEAAWLLEGAPRTWGHVVVDEAQDLSPMQLRMVGRRGPSGSFTVLGDLGQATGLWAQAEWREVAAHLPTPAGVRIEHLTLGYRVSERIMEMAARVLRVAAPHVQAPESVLAEDHAPVVIRVAAAGRAERVAAEVEALAAEPGAVAVIAPAALVDATAAALRAAGLDVGDTRQDGLNHRVSVVEAATAKGLEFDAVVLVEPAAVVEQARHGLRLLYVTLTRAMRRLVVVHAEDLPLCMTAERVA